jgi:hypothetical protein
MLKLCWNESTRQAVFGPYSGCACEIKFPSIKGPINEDNIKQCKKQCEKYCQKISRSLSCGYATCGIRLTYSMTRFCRISLKDEEKIVESSTDSDLPLLMNDLKTDYGKEALYRRLKGKKSIQEIGPIINIEDINPDIEIIDFNNL